MIQTKIYIKSRKRFKGGDIEKINDFLKKNFEKSNEIQEMYFQERSVVTRKLLKDSLHKFDVVLDVFYCDAFDLFRDNKDGLVKIGKLNKDRLKVSNLEDDTALVSELIGIYGSHQNLIAELLYLQYDDTHLVLVDYEENKQEFHLRVWEYKQ